MDIKEILEMYMQASEEVKNQIDEILAEVESRSERQD